MGGSPPKGRSCCFSPSTALVCTRVSWSHSKVLYHSTDMERLDNGGGQEGGEEWAAAAPLWGSAERTIPHHWGSCQRVLPRVRDSLKATSSHQQMKKLWYIYTVECYSAIKRTHLHCSEVDEPRACYTEWSKSERERQTLLINAYIWDLEKWYWRTYLQSRNRDADVENGKLVGTAEERESGMDWESRADIYTLPCRGQTAG